MEHIREDLAEQIIHVTQYLSQKRDLYTETGKPRGKTAKVLVTLLGMLDPKDPGDFTEIVLILRLFDMTPRQIGEWLIGELAITEEGNLIGSPREMTYGKQ